MGKRRHVAIAIAGDVTQAVYLAKEIAHSINVPYGGIYDKMNKMWIEGPFHKLISNDSKLADAVDMAEGQVLPTHKPNPPVISGDNLPALGDEVGLNESDMWH